MPPANCPHCGAVVTSEARKRNVCPACLHSLLLPLPDVPETHEKWDDDPEYGQLATRSMGLDQILRLFSLRTSLSCVAVGCLLAVVGWMAYGIFGSILTYYYPRKPDSTIYTLALNSARLIYVGIILICIGFWMDSNVFPDSSTAVGLSLFYNFFLLGFIVSFIIYEAATIQIELDVLEGNQRNEATSNLFRNVSIGCGFITYILHMLFLVYVAHYFRRYGLVTGLLAFLLISLIIIVSLIILYMVIIRWVNEPFSQEFVMPILLVTMPSVALAVWYTVIVMMLRSVITQEINHQLR